MQQITNTDRNVHSAPRGQNSEEKPGATEKKDTIAEKTLSFRSKEQMFASENRKKTQQDQRTPCCAWDSCHDME